VVGGVTLLAGFWPDRRPAPPGDIKLAAAHPAHPAPTAHPTHPAPPAHPPHPPHPPHRAEPAWRTAPAKTARHRRRGHRTEPDEIQYYVHDGRKRIALTIDDGPSPEYTPQVLRLLEKYKVTATFSMIGLEVASYPGLVREVAAAGHTIANHTWSHPDLAPLAPVTVAGQIDRATDAIHKVTGRKPAMFRAPYGAWSPAVLAQCARTGMTPLDWSVDPRDWSRPGVASIVANILRNTRTGSIILEHDGGGNRSQTVAALKIALPRLQDAGYHFTTL
jgi:peptidoglycan-N-acetylglucosamine deacetylase